MKPNPASVFSDRYICSILRKKIIYGLCPFLFAIQTKREKERDKKRRKDT
jgi:hypothetical protein